MNYCATKNESQPIYRVEWCRNIEDANKYRAGKYVCVYCKENCFLINPMSIGSDWSLCFDTVDGFLALPYRQIVSMIPVSMIPQKEKK